MWGRQSTGAFGAEAAFPRIFCPRLQAPDDFGQIHSVTFRNHFFPRALEIGVSVSQAARQVLHSVAAQTFFQARIALFAPPTPAPALDNGPPRGQIPERPLPWSLIDHAGHRPSQRPQPGNTQRESELQRLRQEYKGPPGPPHGTGQKHNELQAQLRQVEASPGRNGGQPLTTQEAAPRLKLADALIAVAREANRPMTAREMERN